MYVNTICNTNSVNDIKQALSCEITKHCKYCTLMVLKKNSFFNYHSSL